MKLVNTSQRVSAKRESRPVKAISQQAGSEPCVHGGNEVYRARGSKMTGHLLSPEISIIAEVVRDQNLMNVDRFREREGRGKIALEGKVIKHRRGRRVWHVIRGLVMELGRTVSLQLRIKISTKEKCSNKVPGMDAGNGLTCVHEQKKQTATGIRGQATSRGSGKGRTEVVVANITEVFQRKMRAWGSDIQATHSREVAIRYNACCSGNTKGE